jgi:hypothetical protein
VNPSDHRSSVAIDSGDGTGDCVLLAPADNVYESFTKYELWVPLVLVALYGAVHLVKASFLFLTDMVKCGFRFLGDAADEYYNFRDRILARRRGLRFR